jgi:hypothetical protein
VRWRNFGYTMVSIRALVAVHTATHPAAMLKPPSRPVEPEPAPSPDDLHAALDDEAESDPENVG